MFATVFLSIILAMPIITLQELTKPYTLKLEMMAPIGGEMVPLGSICLEPIKLIIEIINNRTDILPDYNLIADAIDHECSAPTGLQEILPFFYSDMVEKKALEMKSSPNPRVHRLPEDRNATFSTAETAYVPPLLLGGLCSEVCTVVGRTLQFFDRFSVS